MRAYTKIVSTFLMVGLSLLLGVDLHAQVAITSLVSGDRIRMDTAPGTMLSGQLIRVHGDSLAFSTSSVSEALLPVSQLQGLRVARSERLGAFDGARAGLLGGIVLGGTLGAVLFAGGDEAFGTGEGFAFGATVVAIPATLIGAIVGTTKAATRWIEVSLPEVSADSGL